MVKRTQNSGRTELLFSMLLLFVFLLCSIFTVLIGSRVYENIRARDNESFYRDTALSYVVNKVRQADETGAVEVRDEGDTSVLVLTSQINGSLYETWIYTLDGTLRELFTPQRQRADHSRRTGDQQLSKAYLPFRRSGRKKTADHLSVLPGKRNLFRQSRCLRRLRDSGGRPQGLSPSEKLRRDFYRQHRPSSG